VVALYVMFTSYMLLSVINFLKNEKKTPGIIIAFYLMSTTWAMIIMVS